MRKQTKVWMIPCAAAIFTMGMTMISFAATGWSEEGGTWKYYDADGSPVTDVWKKSGNNMYYLGGDGEMVKSSLIEYEDNYYYVNSIGAMVSNQWREIDNQDYGDDDASETIWYYFQSSGKAYKAGDSGTTSFKSIKKASGETKKYAFDSEGKMLYGWVNDQSERVTGDDAWTQGLYYCGESGDGAQAVGEWRELEAIDDENRDNEFNDKYWFYFLPGGKKVVDTTKTINGKKYQFDEHGAAKYGWYKKPVASTATASEAESNIYFNQAAQCWMETGWFKAVPSPEVDLEAYENDEEFWFYAQSSGELITSQIKSINGQRYAFNEKGQMLHGLYKLTFADNKIETYELIESAEDLPDADDNAQVYYFGDSPKEGAMKTGTATIDLDGEKYSYAFRKTGSDIGAGIEGISNDMIHVKGRIQKADKDSKYEAIEFEGKEYLVNTSGNIQKKKTNIKDADEIYYCTDENGVVTYSGSEKK